MGSETLEVRLARAAEAALTDNGYVSLIDVLVGMGWLAPVRVGEWRQGRLPTLEQAIQVDPAKLSAAAGLFGKWASQRGLEPSEVDYVSRTRDRRQLQFSAGGDPGVEQAWRTHWMSQALPERKRRTLAERQSRPPDLVVINAVRDWSCSECGSGGNLLIMEEAGPLCMRCADLDHLVFLSRGDAALTRRAKKASSLS